MNIFHKIYCRACQSFLKLVKPFLPYRDPEILDRLQNLPFTLREFGIDRVLIVTDKNIVKTGLTNQLIEELKKAGITFSVYDKTNTNPTIENALEAAIEYLKSSSQAIVAIGGGSVIDCAKAAGAKVTNPSKKLKNMKGLLKISKKLPTLIAIPTTAGSGSEATPTAVISDYLNKEKFTINDFKLLPDIVVCDPDMTENLPKEIVAISGMDALTHAIEAYIGNCLDEESKRNAQEAIVMIFNNLYRAYETGNREARDELLFASYLAGRAFSKAYVGYIHALAHACGGFYQTAHGLANAVLLPVVLEIYRPKIDSKLHELSVLVGLSESDDLEAVGAARFIESIRYLNRNLNIPEILEDLREEDLPDLTARAVREANPIYPVPVLMEEDDLKVILSKVMKM